MNAEFPLHVKVNTCSVYVLSILMFVLGGLWCDGQSHTGQELDVAHGCTVKYVQLNVVCFAQEVKPAKALQLPMPTNVEDQTCSRSTKCFWCIAMWSQPTRTGESRQAWGQDCRDHGRCQGEVAVHNVSLKTNMLRDIRIVFYSIYWNIWISGQESHFVPYSQRIRTFFQRWPGAMDPIKACSAKGSFSCSYVFMPTGILC